MNEVYREAKKWVEMGIGVIPVINPFSTVGGKIKKPPFYDKLPRDIDGKPTWEMFKTTLPDDGLLQYWFCMEPVANLGVITGFDLNHVGLDFDTFDDYLKWFEMFGVNVNTYQVKTNRGMHVHFYSIGREKIGNYSGLFNAEVITEGKYLATFPSVFPNGARYEIWQNAPIRVINSLYEVLPPDASQTGQPSPAVHAPPVTPRPAAAQAQPSPLAGAGLDPWERAALASNKPPQIPTWVKGEIKARMKITDLVDISKGDKSRNGTISLNCPYHDDSVHSAFVDTRLNLFTCHICTKHRGWDVINLKSYLLGLDCYEFYESVVKLAEELSIKW